MKKKERTGASSPRLRFRPLTLDRWADLETLFGPRGACGGCWCMYWRLRRAELEKRKGAGNKRALKRLVTRGEIPGILAYSGREPVGWCSLGPRGHFSVLERSRILKPVDDQPVWSVVCFFVAKGHRHQGVTVQLLRAAVDHMQRHGGRVLEGYPVEPKEGEMPAAFAWTGLAAAFRKAGFKEAARRSETRPIMRFRARAP